ncbi:hypothetical protein CLOP_g13665 [Closterium sp. NIES-67]|nr:hypothetical protein CLOP_g13665 [Closterium sp. NIES-67]
MPSPAARGSLGGSSGSSSQANGSGCQPSSLPGYTCSVQLSKNAGSSSQANGSGCQPSSLPGYTCSVQLSKNAFTRSMGMGHVPIDASAPTTIIWAYSPDASIDFVKGTSTAGQGSSTAAYIAHGVLLALAFALLMPLAILLARLLLADRPHGALLNLNSGRTCGRWGFSCTGGFSCRL